MSLTRLRLGEWLSALGAALLLVAVFALNWYCDPTRSGWRAITTLRWFVLLTAAFGLALAATQALMRGPAVPVTLDLLAMLVAGLTTILLAVRLLSTGATLGAGAYLGVVAAALTALGAFWAMRTEQGWTPGAGRTIEQVELRDPDDPAG